MRLDLHGEMAFHQRNEGPVHPSQPNSALPGPLSLISTNSCSPTTYPPADNRPTYHEYHVGSHLRYPASLDYDHQLPSNAPQHPSHKEWYKSTESTAWQHHNKISPSEQSFHQDYPPPNGIHLQKRAVLRNEDRPFKCDQCPQAFNRNHDLKRHKRIHLAVKPFPCPSCDKSFSRKDALKVPCN